MKICWDLEKIKYRPDREDWEDKHRKFYVYRNSCKNCGFPFLAEKYSKGLFCDYLCANNGENNPMYGKPRSEETKKKISKSQSGDNHPFYGKSRPEHSEAMSGENHPNWKGGLSFEPYCEIWSDKEYKRDIKNRDNNTCQNCGVPEMLSLKVFSEKLSIHHINYIKKDCSPENLITLCRSCNSKANSDREWWQAFYTEIKRRTNG